MLCCHILLRELFLFFIQYLCTKIVNKIIDSVRCAALDTENKDNVANTYNISVQYTIYPYCSSVYLSHPLRLNSRTGGAKNRKIQIALKIRFLYSLIVINTVNYELSIPWKYVLLS